MKPLARRPGALAALLTLVLALSLAACQSTFGREPEPTSRAVASECDVTGVDGLIQAIVDRFDADYEQVAAWVCGGETIDDIMLALQTARVTGRTASEILAASKEVGWQRLWDGYDVPPAAVAAAIEAVPMRAESPDRPGAVPPAPTPGKAHTALSTETGPIVIRLATRSGARAGSAGITWERERFVMVGRIAAFEPENRALRVLVPTEGARDVVYLVQLAPDLDASDLHEGQWVRIQGERGKGSALLAGAIELLHEVRVWPTATPLSTAGGSEAQSSEGGDWPDASGDLGGKVPAEDPDPDRPDADGGAGEQQSQEGAAQDLDKDKDSGKGQDKGKDQDKDKGKGQDKGKGKGKGKGK